MSWACTITLLSVRTRNEKAKYGPLHHGPCIVLHSNSMKFSAYFCKLAVLISYIRTVWNATIWGCEQLTGITEKMLCANCFCFGLLIFINHIFNLFIKWGNEILIYLKNQQSMKDAQIIVQYPLSVSNLFNR